MRRLSQLQVPTAFTLPWYPVRTPALLSKYYRRYRLIYPFRFHRGCHQSFLQPVKHEQPGRKLRTPVIGWARKAVMKAILDRVSVTALPMTKVPVHSAVGELKCINELRRRLEQGK